MDAVWKVCGNITSSVGNILIPKVAQAEQIVIREVQMASAGRAFTRIAGLSGAAAVSLGAYGSHAFLNKKDVDQKLKNTFEIANKYHFLHTLALLAVPLTSRPMLTGTLMTGGIVLFCGSTYYHALTDNQRVRQVTPYGGFLLIFAWLSMAL